MKNLWIVTKNELLRYFTSPLAYVYLVAFLLLNSSFAIYFGHFFERGRADLYYMFIYQPWLYLLFLPGISMRLWAEEFRTKTVLQIMTMPVSITALVWGKFLASWLFCAIALVLTFPFWLTVNYLGSPDNGVIALSYLGSFTLAGCMLAISQTMSALTKNQVIALVLAVVANLLFFLSGLEYVLSLFRLFAPLSIVDMIASFSFLTHFETIIRGLLEARDILFFASIILLFNFTTVVIISFKTAGTSRLLKSASRNYYIFVFGLLLLGFIGLNLLANNLIRSWQYDFTEEKSFTLTDTTKKMLAGLSEPITAKLYYSQILSEKNPDYRLMFDKVRIMLKQYAALSGGKFDYAIYNPQPLDKYEDYALSQGLMAIPVVENNSSAFFGITVSDSIDNHQNIPFLALERQELIEHDLTEAIYILNRKKKNLGIITTLPVFDTVIENVATTKWEVIKQIEKLYNVTAIDKPENITDKLDALMIIHPRGLSPEMTEAIVKYSYDGGKILLFADVAAEASRIFAPALTDMKASETETLEKAWGFVFQKKVVIGDLGNSITVNASGTDSETPNYTQDVIQFFINEDGINPDLPETANLKKIMVSSASILTPDTKKQIMFVPLLKAGDFSALLDARVAQESLNPSDILRNFRPDTFNKIIAARIISEDRSKPFEIIAVADTDLLYDDFWSRTQSMQDSQLVIPMFDNANFVLNALEVLTGGGNLTELRGKTAKTRPFKGIEKMRKENHLQYEIKEQEILRKIDATKDGLREIWGKKTFEGRENFTPDELAIIANIRKELNTLMNELRTIKSGGSKEIDFVDTLVKIINIYTVPLLILLGLAAFRLADRKKNKRQTLPSRFIVTRQLAGITAAALSVLLAGIISVYVSDTREINRYEGRKFFENLPQKINDVRRINIKSNQSELAFRFEDGIWKLEGKDRLLVMQDRMRSFLSALLEAEYYEKKSDKVEHLSRFGLQPIAVKGSPNIRVELLDSAGKPIETFEVGKFNIELGRGTQGAYIKFDNKFQVWLAAIELIDLSANKNEWTFSRIWDLRFGRFISVNGSENVDRLAELAKYMLNTVITPADTPQKPKKVFSADIVFEGGGKVKTDFYQKDDKAYIQYTFEKLPEEKILQLFSEYVKGGFYEISPQQMENIKNVIAKGTK